MISPCSCLTNARYANNDRSKTLLNELLNSLPTFEEAAFFMQVILSNMCDFLSWLLRTIASQIDNRELATLLVLLGIVIYALIKGKSKRILEGLRDIIAAALTLKIIIPALLAVVSSVVIFLAASYIGIWTSGMLLDTLLEIGLVGFPSLYVAANAHSITSIFKRFVLPEIGIGALVVAYIGIESFSLPVEIILQFLILIFSCFQVIGKHQPDGQNIVWLSGCLLSMIGLTVLIAVTIKLVNGWGGIDWITELESIAMGVYYPILMMPFAIVLGYYAAYEMLGIRIKMNPREISFISKAHLYLLLFPSLVDIKHFGYYEAIGYAECLSWRGESDFVRDYKRRIKETAVKENIKLARKKSGLGKTGFDEDGIWQDWESLEEIKTSLWTIASIQNRKWQENHAYSADMQTGFVNAFTPQGCSSGSYVSSDRTSYACWISNGTGFTFGMGASNGGFPPMKYEGATPPPIDHDAVLGYFVNANDEEKLPHWAKDFHTNDSYQ